MYAVEFQAVIENGVVHIPKKYKDLKEKREVRFFIMIMINIEPILKKEKGR